VPADYISAVSIFYFLRKIELFVLLFLFTFAVNHHRVAQTVGAGTSSWKLETRLDLTTSTYFNKTD